MKTLKQQAEEARAALTQRKGQFRAIALAAQLDHKWVSGFAAGNTPNPGVQTIDKLRIGLRAVLKARPLRKVSK